MSFAFQILGMLKQQKEVVGKCEELLKYKNYADLLNGMLWKGC